MRKESQSAKPVSEEEILKFLFDRIDSVPHLEALLLIWNTRPKGWGAEEMAARLFVQPPQVRSILDDLFRRGLLTRGESAAYCYASSPENDSIVAAVAEAYRTDLIRISTVIHSKASSGVIEFARAFKFTRKRKPR